MQKRLFVFVLFMAVFLGCNRIIVENDFVVYDVHEQIATIDQAERFLAAMDRAGVDKIVLLGSPEATFIYKEGFENHNENNMELMKMAEKYPGRFIVFPTIDPRNISELESFERYVDDGAAGLRLFSGQYAWFYRFIGPVNRTEIYPVLQYSDDNSIPVMFNMNPGKEDLQQQFEDLLKRYPNAKIVCPHFCLSSIESERFEYLMDTYPNLYTDISFGHYFEDGLVRISDDTFKFRRLFDKYQDRILFGTDMVITNKTIPAEGDASEWIYNLTMCYRDMLEKERYDCVVKIKNVFNVDQQNLNGLALGRDILRKVYEENAEEWLG